MEMIVLMSSYNGEKYLREQIDSVLAQEQCDVALLVRDDGSKDGTRKILQQYADQGKLKWYDGPNLGPQRSFIDLLLKAPEADCYAFADQDDVWLPEKLHVAAEKLRAFDGPALYFSQTQMVDEVLNVLPTPQLTPALTFPEAVMYAFVSGCTMVLNKKMRDFVCDNLPKEMPMLHDFWCYNVAQAINASVVFDETSHILYRQHSNNVLGLNDSIVGEWKKRVARFFDGSMAQRSRNARILLDTIGDIMPEDNRRQLQMFVKGKESLVTRMKMIFGDTFRSGNKKTNVLMKVSMLMNKY